VSLTRRMPTYSGGMGLGIGMVCGITGGQGSSGWKSMHVADATFPAVTYSPGFSGSCGEISVT